MKKPIAFCLVVGLAACATPAELRKEKPTLELTSSRSAKLVAICIADRWEDAGPFGNPLPIRMRPTSDGFTVSVISEFVGDTWYLADLSDIPNGSQTKYFRNNSMFLNLSAIENAVKECQ